MRIQKSISFDIKTWNNIATLAARENRSVSNLLETLVNKQISQKLETINQHLIKHQK